MQIIGQRTGTPVPKRENELKARVSGPVITYQLSPEELERYRRETPAPKGLGVRTRLAISDAERKAKRMSQTATRPNIPSKEDVLRRLAAGKSIYKIEKELGLGQGALHYWLQKWELKGIKPDRAQQMLDEMILDQKAPEVKDDAAPDPHREVAKKLFEAAPVAADLEPAARIIAAEAELHRQKDEKIERLSRELEAKAARINELERAVAELETERDALLRTVEKAVDADDAQRVGTGHDPVNHPAHYTAGKVECIDAIESATVGLTGGLAYATGAAIKYLWRWSRKGGAEDLRKARWYVDRLIEIVEGAR